MLQTSINNVKILQRSATLHRIFWVKACNLLLPRLNSFMPLRKSLFIKVMTLIFTTILLQVRSFSSSLRKLLTQFLITNNTLVYDQMLV